MQRTYIDELKIGEKQKIQGFVDAKRDQKTIQFIIIRDTTGKIQVTIFKPDLPEIADVFTNLNVNSVVTLEGKVVENKSVKLGGREFIPESVKVESYAEVSPIDEHTAIDMRLDYRWLDLREGNKDLIFKIQTCCAKALRDFLLEKRFVELHTPKIIAAASESGSEVFEVKYFDRRAYLAQSPQFYKQMAMCAGLERIFECAPVFRAEESYTSRHATEFTGFDVEFSYIDSYEDVMKLEEELLAYMLQKVKEQYGDVIKEKFGKEVIVPTLPFPRMKLEDVYRELEERYNFVVDDIEKGDLTTEAEKLVYQLAQDKYNHEFMFITDYNAKKRAFYHMRNEQGVPQGYDLIYRGVEITTGAQREHRYEILKAQAEEKGLKKDVEFYLEFFKYGCPPHGGFGIGLDRITMLLLDLPSIKEAMFIFRGPNRLMP